MCCPKKSLIKLIEDSRCTYCSQHSVKVKDAQWKGHGCTPSFTLHCGKCNKSYPYHTSHTWKKPALLQATKETLKVLPVLFLVGMLLSGLTYHQVSDACFISNIQAGELLHYVDLRIVAFGISASAKSQWSGGFLIEMRRQWPR